MYRTGTITDTTISPKIGEEMFYGWFICGRFTVLYWSTGPGVILYKFWDNEVKEEAVYALATACMLGAYLTSGQGESKGTVFGLELAII